MTEDGATPYAWCMQSRLALPSLQDVILFSSQTISDERGTYVLGTSMASQTIETDILLSHKNTLRGLYYNVKRPIGKCIRVVNGEAFVAVADMREGSPTKGVGSQAILSSPDTALWVPAGFAVGYYTEAGFTAVIASPNRWLPGGEAGVLWSSMPSIEWPTKANGACIAGRDERFPTIHDAPYVPQEALTPFDFFTVVQAEN